MYTIIQPSLKDCAVRFGDIELGDFGSESTMSIKYTEDKAVSKTTGDGRSTVVSFTGTQHAEVDITVVQSGKVHAVMSTLENKERAAGARPRASTLIVSSIHGHVMTLEGAVLIKSDPILSFGNGIKETTYTFQGNLSGVVTSVHVDSRSLPSASANSTNAAITTGFNINSANANASISIGGTISF